MGPLPTLPSDYELPDDFSAALNSKPGLRDAFLAMPPSHRREYLRYVGTAKRPETRSRRIERSLIRIREYADEHSPPPGPP
jgi:uncharacterized protein YdeI (YjbR/CyaY-like superfamily)